MSEYYLDIETYSPTRPIDFHKDPIISIAYQQIDSKTGNIKSPLSILKSWESSEQDILRQFYQTFNVNNRWSFIPIGCKLADFDLIMLGTHWQKMGLSITTTSLFNHPYIDIYPVLLLCNGGTFSGCSLQKFAGKQDSGDKIADWYIAKDYATIESYIKDEAASFIKLYSFLVQRMPSVWEEYAKEQGIATQKTRGVSNG